ncbi:MAG TPA: bifunctional UDP-N-acetylglucosamine diphosphorylase/glucosamine-1-phosphate N-acetyltransferase GlmU [Ktedonobacterales bacterium]
MTRSDSKPTGVFVLAAGKGTRMRSRLPKVAHRVAGRAMVEHVLRAAHDATAHRRTPPSGDHPKEPDRAGTVQVAETRYVLVLGHERDQVRAALRWAPEDLTLVEQEPQLGTGHAVRVARDALGNAARELGTVLVVYGDTPLIRAETLSDLLAQHAASHATITFITGEVAEDNDYGRVVRDGKGHVTGIVERRHATPEQTRIHEVNSGIYCFDAAWLWEHLDHLEPHPNGEYYLTDLIERAVAEKRTVATVMATISETSGVNDRVALAEAERMLRERILRDLMLSGVTIEDPASTYVEAGVRVGMDTILRPGTALRGGTVIGESCEIGPNSLVRDSHIGDGCRILASWVEEARMEAGSNIGPMSHLRPGAHLGKGVHLGNFAEVKNSTLGEGVKMGHFSFLGDATVGAHSNIAAGVITCNYASDGKKYPTTIGERVFIGSDTMLVAPVEIGDDALTGTGAVVRRDVPPGGIAVGMPARVIKYRETKSASGSKDAAQHSDEATVE